MKFLNKEIIVHPICIGNWKSASSQRPMSSSFVAETLKWLKVMAVIWVEKQNKKMLGNESK